MRETAPKEVDTAYWSLSAEESARTLQSDSAHGLAEAEVVRRRKEVGENEFSRVREHAAAHILWRQFRSPLTFILVIAAGTTLAIGAFIDTGIILLAVCTNVLVGFFQEYKAENAIARLRSYIETRARVVRGGVERELAAREVVPGDVVRLTLGSRIPADARLIEVQTLSADEAVLTGESLPVAKHTDALSAGTPLAERANMVFGGTLVTEGNGLALVTATGVRTEFGRIALLSTRARHEATPLEHAVSRLAWFLTAGGVVVVLGIFALGLWRGEALLDVLLVSIAVAVGAIPEALPVALTAVLAVGAERLAKRNGIMQSLAAAETLGSTTLVLTDKTGTLTEAEMRLAEVLPVAEMLKNPAPAAFARRSFSEGGAAGAGLSDTFSHEEQELLSVAVAGTDVLIENPTDAPTEWRMSGSFLEMDIIRAAAQQGLLSSIQERASRVMVPFSSVHKFSVVERVAPPHEGWRFIVLGAPEVLLARSTLGKDEYIVLQEHIATEAALGKRLVGVAVSEEAPTPGSASGRSRGGGDLDRIRNLSFLGALAFFAPVRKEVPEALRRIEAEGVRVVMATGDLKGTAVAVAKELGWNVSDSEVLIGADLATLSDEALLPMLAKVKIFARVTPEDKLRVARLFQRRGDIVAMTGDGVNDAPSLKAVDIGIAVGSGSDVAKAVADLVLLDNNFNTIVAAIEEGKRVLRNIRKTFVYLVSTSLDEVMLIGGSLLFALPLPLSALQIIWVNFFTEGLPAIAFAFDGNHGERAPSARTEKEILNRPVRLLTIGVGTLSSVLLFLLYWWLLEQGFAVEVARTFIFACFASYILFVSFSLQSLERPLFSFSIFSNRLLVIGVVFGLVLLSATLYVPFFQNIFNTVPLGPVWLFALSVWVAFNILLVEGAKWIFYTRASGR